MIENMIKTYARMIKPYTIKLSNNDYLKVKKLILETIEEEDKRRGL
jgi:hypothetical protein